MISYYKDYFTTIGRAKIEHQKQIELEKIQTQKEARLKQLDIKYETADKAKTSFGYIGITFLTVLFGSILLNDFLKVCIYYFNHLREWWRRNDDREQANNDNHNQEQRQRDEEQVQIEMDDVYGEELEEQLERVYLRLLELNANRRRRNQT